MDIDRIRKRLIELRGEKSQAQVANDLGISDSAISAYEQGDRIPRDEVKIRIATSPHAQNISVNHTARLAGAMPDSTEATPTTTSMTICGLKDLDVSSEVTFILTMI